MTDQVDSNYLWFKSHLAELLTSHQGQHALLHKKAVSGFYQDSLDAVAAGLTRYGEGNFSVERVDNTPEDLGFFSHVGTTLRA